MGSANETHLPVDNKTQRLLTVDQINEEFPVMMYKVWKASREEGGLSTESGIATSSMNPLMHDNLDTTLQNEALARSDTAHAGQCSHKLEATGDVSGISTDNAQAMSIMTSSVPSITRHCETKCNNIPHSPRRQLVEVVEDKCAICLEVPEDDDVVRSLKCGHCYHQTCIDPWLTNQRGACPLCKLEFYLPSEPHAKAEPESTLLSTVNGHQSLHETSEFNVRVQNTRRNDLMPPSPAITRTSLVHRMNDSWYRSRLARPLPLYTFRREHNLRETEDILSQLEHGEM